MKRLLFYLMILIILGSCGNTGNGELIGVQNRPKFYQPIFVVSTNNRRSVLFCREIKANRQTAEVSELLYNIYTMFPDSIEQTKKYFSLFIAYIISIAPIHLQNLIFE